MAIAATADDDTGPNDRMAVPMAVSLTEAAPVAPLGLRARVT
ncbi:MAG: hypothetical protein ABIQ66_08455 [Novosphingobium sp.]